MTYLLARALMNVPDNFERKLATTVSLRSGPSPSCVRFGRDLHLYQSTVTFDHMATTDQIIEQILHPDPLSATRSIR